MLQRLMRDGGFICAKKFICELILLYKCYLSCVVRGAPHFSQNFHLFSKKISMFSFCFGEHVFYHDGSLLYCPVCSVLTFPDIPVVFNNPSMRQGCTFGAGSVLSMKNAHTRIAIGIEIGPPIRYLYFIRTDSIRGHLCSFVYVPSRQLSTFNHHAFCS